MTVSGHSAIHRARVTYRLTVVTFHHGAMDVGNHRVSARGIVLKPGNDYMCIYRKFGLRVELAVAAEKRWDAR